MHVNQVNKMTEFLSCSSDPVQGIAFVSLIHSNSRTDIYICMCILEKENEINGIDVL